MLPAPARLKSDLLELQNALLRGAVRGGGTKAAGSGSAERSIKEYGSRLFAFLFHSKIDALYRKTLVAIEQIRPQQALRIKLRMDADELSFVPWETLYDNELRVHVCPSLRTLFLRSAATSHDVLARPPPFHILGMIARPRRFQNLSLANIDADRERADMADALEPLEATGKITLSWTTSGNFRDFKRRMVKPDHLGGWTVFHFIGHGDFDRDRRSGFLLFEEVGGSGAERLR